MGKYQSQKCYAAQLLLIEIKRYNYVRKLSNAIYISLLSGLNLMEVVILINIFLYIDNMMIHIP